MKCCCQTTCLFYKLQCNQGRTQDLAGGGGVQEFIFFHRFGNMHVTKRHAALGEAMRFASGVRGHARRENFLKWCNLVRFGVYLD